MGNRLDRRANLNHNLVTKMMKKLSRRVLLCLHQLQQVSITMCCSELLKQQLLCILLLDFFLCKYALFILCSDHEKMSNLFVKWCCTCLFQIYIFCVLRLFISNSFCILRVFIFIFCVCLFISISYFFFFFFFFFFLKKKKKKKKKKKS